MKIITAGLLAFIILLFSTHKVEAIVDPLSVPNNRFGIHIVNEKDLDSAASLVNSQGGEWGYVTIVITEGERDRGRWQTVFDQMRRLKLIPIIRLATKANGPVWEKPKVEEINNWIAFLNSLNWVTQNRYVIISNETNHAYEWGGELKPEEYASYLKIFSQELKSASDDFFILPGALDASATNNKETMESSKYVELMLKAEPDVFEHIDGWNSHSYPNPHFSGDEKAKGKGTVAGFDWELSNLEELGVNTDFPVFITETGWSANTLTDEEIAERLVYSFENVWNDPRIVAVTPFILNYPQPPFGQFTWTNSDGSLKSYYHSVRNMEKLRGKPKQIVKGDILAAFAQPLMLTGSNFAGIILARNTGQSVWHNGEIFVTSDSDNFFLQDQSFSDIEPMRLGLIIYKAAAPETSGIYSSSLFLKDDEGKRISGSFRIEALATKFNFGQIRDFFVAPESRFGRLLGL